MSTRPSSDSDVAIASKQPTNITTVMLLLSALFLVIAVIAMYLEIQRWTPDLYKTNTAKPNVMIRTIVDYELA